MTLIRSLTALALFTLPLLAADATPDAKQIFDRQLSSTEREVVGATEAMPADKYDFAPTTGEFKGVRTFGQQLTHIAEAQYFFFDGFGVKPTVDVKSIEKLTPEEILKRELATGEPVVYRIGQSGKLKERVAI